MVGEIRDTETATLAVNAALTGHLVLSTLHTNSAAGAVPRMMDMDVEPFLLSSTIRVVIAQRLVRRLFSKSEPYKLPKEEITTLSEFVNFDRIIEEQSKYMNLKKIEKILSGQLGSRAIN